jgi:hypothetical protein
MAVCCRIVRSSLDPRHERTGDCGRMAGERRAMSGEGSDMRSARFHDGRSNGCASARGGAEVVTYRGSRLRVVRAGSLLVGALVALLLLLVATASAQSVGPNFDGRYLQGSSPFPIFVITSGTSTSISGHLLTESEPQKVDGTLSGSIVNGTGEIIITYGQGAIGSPPGSTSTIPVSEVEVYKGAVTEINEGAFTNQNPTYTSSTGHGRASIGHVTVSGTTASVAVSCSGASSCTITLTLSALETLLRGKVIAVAASAKTTKKTVVLGYETVTAAAGTRQTVKLSLNGTGKKLLGKHNPLRTKLRITQASKTVASSTITFKAKSKKT